MSPRACTETLSRRLEAKLSECRESLSFLEKAVKMAGGQTPGQEQEVLVSAIETSAIFHKSADRIYESLLVWLSEEELDHRYQPARRHIITDATAGRRHLENNATGDDHSH